MNNQVDPTSSNLASAMLNSKIRPREVVGYGVKIFHPSPPNYVTRSPDSIKGSILTSYLHSSNEHHLGLKSDLERSVFSVDFFETFLRISTRSFSFPPSFWLLLHKYQFIVLLVKLKFWHYSESRVNNGGPEFSHVYLLFYIHNLFKMLSWEWKITVKNVTVRVSSANLSYWETETYNSNCHFDCRRRAF